MKLIGLAIVVLFSTTILADECQYQNTSRAEIEAIIKNRADHYRVDQHLIWAMVQVESNFDPCIVSDAGAMGLMQLMPSTIQMEGVTDTYNPMQNIDAGTRLIAEYLGHYEVMQFALAAYNAGPGAVKRYRMTPPYDETKRYIRKVVKAYETKRGNRTEWLVWSLDQQKHRMRDEAGNFIHQGVKTP